MAHTNGLYYSYDTRHKEIEGGRKHSKQRDVLMLGAEGCLGSLLREPQQIKEGDGEGGKREERREFLGKLM